MNNERTEVSKERVKKAVENLMSLAYKGLKGPYLFSWNEILGEDKDKLIKFLKELGAKWVKTEKIEKVDKNTIKISDQRYLFKWDEIPGKNDEKLKEILKQNYDIDLKAEKIEKSKDGKNIRVYTENKSILLTYDNEKSIVNLKIDDVNSYEFIVKTENGKLNIYNEMNSLLLKPVYLMF